MRLPAFLFASSLAGAGLLLAACATGTSAPPASPAAAPLAFAPAPELPATEPAAAVPAPRLQPAAWAAPPVLGDLPAPRVSAAAAVVLDEASGAALFEQAADVRLPLASLTKIASALVVLEDGIPLDAEVTVDVDSRYMRGSSVMGLHAGDRFTVRDLLYGLMLPSGNDAALALGRAVAGSDAAFVQRMNDLMARLGLEDTNFANAHGLSARDHYSTAWDLAVLSRYAMANPQFAEIARAGHWVAHGSRTIALNNVNSFLGYPGADGIKTGFTYRAGRTLVASAVRDGRRLFAVLLNAPDRDGDAAALLDWAFANSEPAASLQPPVASP
ncbi:MAG: D-alanyl-D-alanine carboxypeptidase [Dehalococcoidia bacterium]|nr:D-alanyl-D-alanine carboxypeptidase [Dehalococcoidia bacterium]